MVLIDVVSSPRPLLALPLRVEHVLVGLFAFLGQRQYLWSFAKKHSEHFVLLFINILFLCSLMLCYPSEKYNQQQAVVPFPTPIGVHKRTAKKHEKPSPTSCNSVY